MQRGDRAGRPRPPFNVRGFLLAIGITSAIIALGIYWLTRPSAVVEDAYNRGATRGPRKFTREQLWQYRGENGPPVYLAVKGRVYDVSAGMQHYGPGGAYSGFAGRDASRAFVDMCFSPECMKVAHITDEATLTKDQKDSVEHWASFYEKERLADGRIKYPFVGVIVDDAKYDASKPWFASPSTKKKE